MNNQLNGGDSFPDLPLTMVDGSERALPTQPSADYLVALFYRGSF
jgi:hypothetical protein